jgi:hypothetical protein
MCGLNQRDRHPSSSITQSETSLYIHAPIFATTLAIQITAKAVYQKAIQVVLSPLGCVSRQEVSFLIGHAS